MIVYLVGDSALSDAFNLANRFLAVARRAFVDGSFDSTLMSFTAKNQKDGKEKSFIKSAFLTISSVLLLIGLGIFVFRNFVKDFYRLDFLRGEYFSAFLKYMFLLPFLMMGISFFSTILNFKKKFFYVAFAPFFGNLFFMAAIGLGIYYKASFWPLVIGSMLYAGMQMIFLLFFSYENIETKEPTETNKEFLYAITKVSSSSVFIPISDLFCQKIASSIAVGTVSHLEYGHKIIQFVFSVLATPLFNVINPILAVKANEENSDYEHYAGKIIVLTSILVIPCSITIIFHGYSIAVRVFSRFSSISNPDQLSIAISVLGFSLYFYVITRLFSYIMIASRMVGRSSITSIFFAIVQLIFSWLLVGYGVKGLAWASNLAIFCQFLLLLYFALKEKKIKFFLTDIVFLLLAIVYGFIVQFPLKFFYSFFDKILLSLPFNSIISFGLSFLIVFIPYIFIFKNYLNLLL